MATEEDDAARRRRREVLRWLDLTIQAELDAEEREAAIAVGEDVEPLASDDEGYEDWPPPPPAEDDAKEITCDNDRRGNAPAA